jgi:hypothetical protein
MHVLNITWNFSSWHGTDQAPCLLSSRYRGVSGLIADMLRPPSLTHRRHAAPRSILCDLHVPENRCSELEDVPDVPAEGRRLDPFSPRHVRHFAESHLLDFVGPKLPSRLIGRSRPVGDELLQLRDVRPAVPAALPAREAEVHGWINDVSPLQPSMEQVPAALVGCPLRVRATSIVDQSIPLRTTLKPIDSSRWRVTMAAALRTGMSVTWSTTIGRPS